MSATSRSHDPSAGIRHRLGIHMGDHKHFVGARFDGHGGDEPVGIETGRKDAARFEIGFGKGLGIGELCHGAVFRAIQRFFESL